MKTRALPSIYLEGIPSDILDAAKTGQIKELETALEHYEEKQWLTYINVSFVLGAINGHVNLLRHLLSCTKLGNYINLHYANDAAFIWACKLSRCDIVTFLVMEGNIKKTSSIRTCLKYFPEVKELFATRKFHASLQRKIAKKKTSPDGKRNKL